MARAAPGSANGASGAGGRLPSRHAALRPARRACCASVDVAARLAVRHLAAADRLLPHDLVNRAPVAAGLRAVALELPEALRHPAVVVADRPGRGVAALG